MAIIPVSVRVLDPSIDLDAVCAVVDTAFAAQSPAGSRPVEVGLTRALVEGGHVPRELGLVAVDGDRVVGTVIGSVGRVAETDAIGLGPVAVPPGRQSAGIGSALVSAAVDAANGLGFPVVVLLGDPGYYARFGFVTAAGLGVVAPDPAWGVHFQARRLSAWSPSAVGTFRYAAPFDEL